MDTRRRASIINIWKLAKRSRERGKSADKILNLLTLWGCDEITLVQLRPNSEDMLTDFINNVYKNPELCQGDGVCEETNDAHNSLGINQELLDGDTAQSYNSPDCDNESRIGYFQDGSQMLSFPLGIYESDSGISYPIAIGQIASAIVTRKKSEYGVIGLRHKCLIFLPEINGVKSENLKAELGKAKISFLEDNDTDVKLYSAGNEQGSQSDYKKTIKEELRKQRSELEVGLIIKFKARFNDNKWLIRDGSIKYDLEHLDKFPEHTLWVSKSWDMPDDADINKEIRKLKDLHRTQVCEISSTGDGSESTDKIWYRWYMRPREQYDKRTFDSNIIMCELKENPDTYMDSLCKSIICHEAYSTCFGVDKRWERHLYGVHVAEMVCKSLFHSQEVISNLAIYNGEQ